MKAPTKIFLTGCSVSAVCFFAGRVALAPLQSNLGSLVTECHVEGVKVKELNTDGTSMQKDRLVCDPRTLVRLGDSVGIQAQIIEAQKELTSYTLLTQLGALFVFAIGAAPLLWYFLLQRIRELREAVVGT
jgi:hypothetical protein